jgi:hypothetical protein
MGQASTASTAPDKAAYGLFAVGSDMSGNWSQEMSSTKPHASSAKPGDAMIILSYLIVAVGIFIAFYLISVSPEAPPVDLDSLTRSP